MPFLRTSSRWEALELGATHVINSIDTDTDAVAFIRENKWCVNGAYDAAGVLETFTGGVSTVCPGGEFKIVSV
ncbi:hypothetical protein ACQKMV_07900 [Lysinibacillus sp. NPDC094403]|uniref:hypothetical protein n=1 Tax=Lysinibacillus sp. NPDC094403 TaxID=3390581 RepID=UPI003D00C528